MIPRQQILLVDDSESFRSALKRALSTEYVIRDVASSSEALSSLSPPPDVILLDLRLDEGDPRNAATLEFLARLRLDLPEVPVIMITAYGDVDTAVECMRLGATDFIQKGGDVRELRARIERALEQARLSSRLRQVEEELEIIEPRQIIGDTRAMREVKELIAAVARDGHVTVLITGETGTGKELVARAIHASGARAQRPFVPVALAALASSTLESELFGHEQGAFTDAQRRHLGFIERAQGGVLFLDEIAELPAALQVKLLRVLEERVITRLGGREEIPMDLQVLAATNADLTAAIAEDLFREDLYYRLKVCEIRLPPLRTHPEDIPLLVNHYVARLAGPTRGVGTVSPEAMEELRRYAWPGNVRELRNSVEAALLRASLRGHSAVELTDLPEEIREPKRTPILDRQPLKLDYELARAELRLVERAMESAGGRKSDAWKLLGLNDRFALRRRVVKLLAAHAGLEEEFPVLAKQFSSRESN